MPNPRKYKSGTEYPATLKAIIQRGNYSLELVFNIHEMGLFWKRIPKHTFLSRDVKRAPGFKTA